MAVTKAIVSAIIALSTTTTVVLVNSSVSPIQNSLSSILPRTTSDDDNSRRRGIFGLTRSSSRSVVGSDGRVSGDHSHRGWAIGSTLRGGSTAATEEEP
eukprot:CAMPEP_0198262276 /NCGR_PEP_ID=MMETSP1447-20131203/10816_1 /TAXON_ID=420782 /ORGANISM="Chaetoceros dichaeta, Strain CCMP1751" /LENGTH=98 /DNA_ID=CAMNT_0043950459 /DNA_START=19 /DNA_END=312 /DNA_ORIENTATION=-